MVLAIFDVYTPTNHKFSNCILDSVAYLSLNWDNLKSQNTWRKR